MDQNPGIKDISRQLYSRGMHRMFGNPTIGTISGFLTVIFLIRISVNLYFVLNISSGDASMNLEQITAGWYFYLAVYLTACSSLSAVHINFALPKRCFLELSEGRDRFKSIFLKQAILIRPMNIAVIVLIVIGSFIFIKSGTKFLSISGGIITLLFSLGGAVAVFRVARRLSIAMDDIQMLEAVFLTAIVMVNPDIIRIGGRVQMFFNGALLSFEKAWVTAAACAGVFMICCILLLTLRAVTALNKVLESKKTSTPMISWYYRFFRIKYWILLYILIIPAIWAPFAPLQLKRQFAVIYILFTMFSYLFFLLNCENTIEQKWRTSLLKRNNAAAAVRPFLIHLALTLIPLSGLIFA